LRITINNLAASTLTGGLFVGMLAFQAASCANMSAAVTRVVTGSVQGLLEMTELRKPQNTSGSGEAVQTLSATQGVRKKKSIALPRCICGPFSTTTIPDSEALRMSQNCNTKR